MQKIDLGKPTTTINSRMNRKELYMDIKNMDKLKNNLLKQLGSLSKTLIDLDSTLGKLCQKNFFEGDYKDLAIQCSRKCSSQAQSANSLVGNLELKYSDDVKNVAIKNLDERISYLEEMFLSNK